LIKTDGISVSIYFRKEGQRPRQKSVRVSKEAIREEVKNKYFENHIEAIKNNPNVVVIDPNKRDLLYCKDAKGNRLRYTSMQRRKEVGTKKYT
jgi:hypothetical protein